MSAGSSLAKLEEELDRHSRWAGSSLSRFLARSGRRSGYHPFVGDIHKSIREFALRGGKRIASFTVALVCRGYGFGDLDALAVACDAIELYRHCILIHDDLVDGDDTRRGGPTLNRKYADLRDGRLGLGCSVFAGNIAFCLSLSRVLDSDLCTDLALGITGEITRAYSDVNESQALDLWIEGADADLETWRRMASKRAASLFRATLRVGAMLSAAQRDLETLGKAGEQMGFAFDIQDDIIDVFSTAQDYGRQPGSDLKTLKRPLHVVLALGDASADQLAALRSPKTGLERFRMILRDTGAVEEAKQMAARHASRALKLIETTGMNREAKDLFASLMAYMGQSLQWYT